MQKIGIFGGSFNPAHEGHLMLARSARCLLNLDKILCVVVDYNPLKKDVELPDVSVRIDFAKKKLKLFFYRGNRRI